MSGSVSWQKFLLLGALVIAPLLLAQCGDGSESVATNSVGPTGPSNPGGYYMELTVSPHTVPIGGGPWATVRVWDSSGNGAAGVTLVWSTTGVEEFEAAGGILVTNDNGYAYFGMEIKGAAYQSLLYLSATVENLTLTIPVKIMGPII